MALNLPSVERLRRGDPFGACLPAREARVHPRSPPPGRCGGAPASGLARGRGAGSAHQAAGHLTLLGLAKVFMSTPAIGDVA